MQRNLLWALGAGGTVMVLTAWFYYPGPERTDLRPEQRRYMHCLDCGKEWPYEFHRFQKGCPRCDGERPLYPTKEPYANSGNGPNIPARLLAPLLLELTFLFAVLLYLATANKSDPKKQEAPFFYLNCPKCGRKLRYPEKLSGRAGKCPTCKKAVYFPVPA